MRKVELRELWTAEVVGKMHRYGITQKQLAKRCWYTPSYISQVLNCKKEFSCEESKERTKTHIIDAVDRLANDILGGRV